MSGTGTTTRERFDELLGTRRVIPVARELFADGETPVGIYRKLADGRPGTFLLESAEQGGIFSRYSFVGVAAFGVLTQNGDDALWLDYGLDASSAFGSDAASRVSATPSLELLALLYERWRSEPVEGLPPRRVPELEEAA